MYQNEREFENNAEREREREVFEIEIRELARSNATGSMHEHTVVV